MAECPTCHEPLRGLARYCEHCEAYVEDMDIERLELELPLPTNLANARLHWARKNTKKKEYWEDCDRWVRRRLSRPLSPARMTATLYVWNEMDEDNLTARLKWTQDWLVDRGFLEDDSPKHLTLDEITQAIDRKRTRVEIVLERVA